MDPTSSIHADIGNNLQQIFEAAFNYTGYPRRMWTVILNTFQRQASPNSRLKFLCKPSSAKRYGIWPMIFPDEIITPDEADEQRMHTRKNLGSTGMG